MEKAYGNYYFIRENCPISVKRVQVGLDRQHEHDLTHVPHVHDFSELVVVTGGSGTQMVDDEEYPVCCGDVFLLQGGAAHYFPDHGSLRLVNIQYDPAHLPLPLDWLRKIPGYNIVFQLEPTLRSRRNLANRLHLAGRELALLEDKIRNLAGELEECKTGYEGAAFAALLDIIVLISRAGDGAVPDHRNPLPRIGSLISRMERQYAKPWTLAELAQLAGTSPNNLLRLFRAATGTTPIDYLLKLRLRHAAEQLTHSPLAIAEIAANCGFADSNYFTKKFSSLYQTPPGEYRKKAMAGQKFS